jgi:tRNA A37 threonylcarbamoyladenosine dehydratase
LKGNNIERTLHKISNEIAGVRIGVMKSPIKEISPKCIRAIGNMPIYAAMGTDKDLKY